MIRFNVSTDIIHGDIKPQNVLIFKGHDGEYTARVTDFGYSTRYANDINFIVMPRSWPWFAPEHDRDNRMWRSFEAKRMDYFSFDLSCLWFLFEKELSASISPFEKTAFGERYKIPYSLYEQSIEILHKVKVNQKLSLLAQRLLKADKNLTKIILFFYRERCER